MFTCQITFSKVFLSMSNKYVFTGVHLNATNFYVTMQCCFAIQFHGSLLIIASKAEK